MPAGHLAQPKPTIWFILASLAAMVCLTIGIAQQIGSGLEHGQGSLVLAQCCAPIGLIHIAAIFWSLFRRGIASTVLALLLYELEGALVFVALAAPAFRGHKFPDRSDLVALGILLFSVICAFLSWRWLQSLRQARSATIATPPQ